ncbi:molybdenum cofactor guanylyltransferase MobA [Histophilus somni]|uniref:molybdenum cofactor guanylyltransferase MobA n=1 Tax=Histophilus somni TaxID=731 RepID=UPI00109D7764|nr:molybdenum cofactor guanylyltransferase MobA [Histophilus somni]QEH18517.1 molybdenum cofactor guanylyltransferase MobA [Histophilus somni]THA21304.1 molybdenum cofactor guanylyltransferase MobA [Histophilus somni]
MATTISAVILAGGQAKRMAGLDKGLQLLQGKPLYQHCLQRLTNQVSSISINANRHQAIYQQSGVEVFGDELEDFQGPLSGILTALERANTDFVLFVPCDSPFLPLNLCEKLQSAVENSKSLLAYANDGEREHPAFSLLSTQLKLPLRVYLQSGHRQMLQFFRQHKGISVDFSLQKQAFVNMNTLQDIEKYQNIYA